MLKVLKMKDMRYVDWDDNKIITAIKKASERAINNKLTNEQVDEVLYIVKNKVDNKAYTNTNEIHSFVMEALFNVNQDVYLQYKSYRDYKKRYAESLKKTKELSEKIVIDGDNENANKDSTLNSTKQSLISEVIMKELMETFELNPEWEKAMKEGWIHIHDKGSRYLNQINCQLFDLGNLLKRGIYLNGGRYTNPSTIQTAFAVVGDVTLSTSAQEYGGFTLSEIDTVLAPYAESTYNKYYNYYLSKEQIDISLAEELAYDRTVREIEKGYIGFETKLNTISNSLGQIPFVSVSFGMDTSKWARKISETILKVRKDGMGEDKMTAVFPKLIFITRKEVNRNSDAPNYDLYKKAIDCSRTRLYPDYLSLDGENNNLREVYERSGKIVSPMGCRAYLSPFFHPETGEEIYTGRSNIGAVTLNIVKIAIESGKDIDKFYELIKKYSDMVFEIHEDAYERIGKSKGATNPLTFCEGGSWMSVGYDEPIAPILKASTASLGYVGLEETCQYMFGESITKHQEFALDIVRYLKKQTEEATKKYDHLYALYSTPAENLVYKFNEMNREQYGIIENVTSREYMTNSFHVQVAEDISVPEKIAFEAPFHEIATGGRISYCELPYGVDNNVLKQAIDFAMDKGMYYGVNVISATCGGCNHHGDFDETCPVCGSEEITSVSRVCGYLSFGKVKGKSRYNLGKQAEIRERVKHNVGFGENLNKFSKEQKELI